MNTRIRPLQVSVMAGLLLLAGMLMIYLGFAANAYFISGAVLLLAAALLWLGTGFKVFKNLLLANQITAILLLIFLFTGLAGLLSLPKLTITGALMVINVFIGGPLLGILAIPILASMHFSRVLPDWFQGARP
jgi:hypothetical protein